MDIFKEKIAKRKTNIPGISADIKETLSQRKSINEGLQDL